MLINSIKAMLSGGQVDFTSILAQIVSVVVVIFLVLPFHELAHAFVALKLGDKTAKWQGRLTFNPLASVDPMGALFLLLFGFGWAKPVPVNPMNFRKPKRDMAITALAGPVSNFIAALVGGIIYCALIAANVFTPMNYSNNVLLQFLALFLNYYVIVNISVAVFNLLPVPPLDGSRIIGAFLTDRALSAYYRYQNIIMPIFFVIIMVGVLDTPLSYARLYTTNAVIFLAQLPFKLFGVQF